MKPSDDLFQLVRSLSQTEKRYIRIMIGSFSEKQNNCLKLLEAMEKQEVYDEAKIKARLKNEKFSRQLTFTKNYLYKLVLKGLRSYHSGASPEIQIAEALVDIEILYNKSQHKPCIRAIEKAKSLCYAYERFPFILELVRWERKAMSLESYTGNKTGRLSKIAGEEEKVSAAIREINDHRELLYRTVDIVKRANTVKNDRDMALLQEIVKDRVLTAEPGASYTALICRYNILELCYFALGVYEKCYENSTRQVALLEQHMHLTRYEPVRYSNALNNHILICQALGKAKEAGDAIQKLRHADRRMGIEPSENLKLRMLSRIHRTETAQVGLTGEFTKGMAHAAEAKKFLERWGTKTDPETRLVLYYGIAYICFGAGSYKEALLWISKILNAAGDGLRQDIFCNARVLNLFIHFELHNHELLEHLSRSTSNYLVQRGRLSKAETLVVRFIKNLHKAITNNKLPQELLLLKKKLEQAFDDPAEKRSLLYFDFISWIESKLQHRDFEEVVKAKNRSRQQQAPAKMKKRESVALEM